MISRNSIMLIAAASVMFYQMQRIHVLKADRAVFQTQISALQEASELQSKRFESARKDAEEAIKHSQERANTIMAANVPKDCEGAIKWGIREARNFDRPSS